MSATIIWQDDALQKALKRLAEQCPQRTEEALTQACADIEAEAKERCPVDTGELRRSITSDVIKKDEGHYVGRVGTNLYYAVFAHEGTGLYSRTNKGRKDVPWHYRDEQGKWHTTYGQVAQPFLQDAVDVKSDEIIKYFRRIIRDERANSNT